MLRVLAINDFHGNLEPPSGSSGRIQTGPDPDGAGPGMAPTVDAGGANYLATHLDTLRTGVKNAVFVGAGDLVGASPLISGIFHDEPTVEVMNQMGMAYAGVGNHEFDEGAAELIRLQFGGCHPTEGCFGGDGFMGAAYRYLAANVRRTGTGDTILPPYMIKRAGDIPVAYIGLTLEGTPTVVTAAGVAGLQFDDEADTVNRLVRELSDRAGIEAFVILVHEGGQQNPGAGQFADVDGCLNPSGAIFDIADRIDDRVDALVSAHTHQPYLCERDGKAVTSAASFGRLITTLDMRLDGRSGDVTSITTDNHIVTRTVPENAGVKAIVDRYRTASQPLANRVVGRITADLNRTAAASGETTLGDVIADAQLAGASDNADGAPDVAFMNPGGIRTDITYAQSGTEGNGIVTFGEIFAVQPFGNLVVTKTMTGADIDAVLEQQFTAAGANRVILQVSDGFEYTYSASAPFGSKVDIGSIQINGVPIDPAGEYVVVMNSFLADGGDGFTKFRDGTSTVVGSDDLIVL
jgi:5'-nucleotidase